MFSQKKGKVDITHSSPQFLVRYVGKMEVFTASGKGCTHRPVQRIWDSSVEEKDMPRRSLIVNPSGIRLTTQDDRVKRQYLFDIKDISYCCAESGAHERVFSWICKNEGAKKLECHAVLCGSPEKAKYISMCLSRAFQIAYRDWKTLKEKEQRMKQNGLISPGQSRSVSRSASQNDMENGGLSAKEEAELNAALAQMNFVEEEEFSFTDSSITTTSSNP